MSTTTHQGAVGAETRTAGLSWLRLPSEQKPIKSFPNRAGQTDTDDAIAFELENAGIEVHRLELLRKTSGEVKTSVRGELHGWSFTRAWRYWIAEGPGIELAAADALYAAHPETVRIDGHCGCPSPREWFKGLAVGHYHVDSPAGLKGLADTIKALVDRPATPAPRTDGGMTAGEDANFGDAPHDLVSEIATQVLNLPWTRLGLTDPRSGHFDHDALADRHGDVQIIAEKALRGARASDAESAGPFERTRAYLLAELERLRADLHTIGEDLTGEQGKAASWLDVATGRAANVSSVLASATPAQPAGAVPDGLRETLGRLSRAAETLNGSQLWLDDNSPWRIMLKRGRFNAAVAEAHPESAKGDGEWNDGAVICAIVNEAIKVAAILSTHPAGQSAGSGAEWRGPHVGPVPAAEPIPNAPATPPTILPLVAPDSTRTGQVGVAVEQAVAKAAVRAVEQLENAASGGLFHCEADREEAVEIVTEALWTSPLAARPAAPEAQGAWSLEPEGKPIQGFPNRAGETDTDDAIAFELEAAGIEVHRLEVLRKHSGEVKTAVRGELHGWSFKRAWRYWAAEGPGIELAAANVLHAAHPATVRVNGHCGCPSPHEQNHGLAIGSYHVDSPAGLKGLADTIKAIVARSAPPSSSGQGGR